MLMGGRELCIWPTRLIILSDFAQLIFVCKLCWMSSFFDSILINLISKNFKSRPSSVVQIDIFSVRRIWLIRLANLRS